MHSAKMPKKTETIGIRLSIETKAAFMARCREERRTAREALRLFIDEQVAPRPTLRRRRASYRRMIVAGVLGALIGASAAAPSLVRDAVAARSSADSRVPTALNGLGGAVPFENIGGRAEFITFSLNGKATWNPLT